MEDSVKKYIYIIYIYNGRWLVRGNDRRMVGAWKWGGSLLALIYSRSTVLVGRLVEIDNYSWKWTRLFAQSNLIIG